jgi:predicted ATP-grasp superfamily ATP-dependent carboligase
MRLFIYEFVTGGGLWGGLKGLPREAGSIDASPSTASLLKEGRAMVQAVTSDFCGLPDVEVWTTRDVRLPELHPTECRVTTIASPVDERQALEKLAAEADWTLLIAPETAGALADRCEIVESVGGRLISPSTQVVQIAADKQATAELLTQRGVPTPQGAVIQPGSVTIPSHITFPAVLKPVDGCGSEGVRLIRDPPELFEAATDRPMRLEEFVPGLAASVAVLAGPSGCHALPACQQRLSKDSRFSYLGGRLPLSAALDRRARRLAQAAIAALPQPRGYIGVDMVFGEADNGSGDRVIEINPRLTTSYVGLRAVSQSNLASAMLAVAAGREPALRFSDQAVEFTSDGRVYH